LLGTGCGKMHPMVRLFVTAQLYESLVWKKHDERFLSKLHE
jgi:hypothetical protein